MGHGHRRIRPARPRPRLNGANQTGGARRRSREVLRPGAAAAGAGERQPMQKRHGDGQEEDGEAGARLLGRAPASRLQLDGGPRASGPRGPRGAGRYRRPPRAAAAAPAGPRPPGPAAARAIQMRIVWSSLADASMYGLWGFHATALTVPVWPSSFIRQSPLSRCQM